MLCNASTVLSCIENPPKPVDEQTNYIIMMYVKLPHKHGNLKREYWLWERKPHPASLMAQAWPMCRIQAEAKEIFFLAALQAMISHIQTRITYWHFSISKGLCELLNTCTHTQLQTANPGYSEMQPWNENTITRVYVRKTFVFLFCVCFAWLSRISWIQYRPLAAASYSLRHW